MIIKHIAGCTRELGKSQNFRGLPIRDYLDNEGRHNMMSAWELEPKEKAAIAAGSDLYLSVMAPPDSHPPVLMFTGEPPEQPHDSGGFRKSWIRSLLKAYNLGFLEGPELNDVFANAPQSVLQFIYEHFQTDSPDKAKTQAMLNPITPTVIEKMLMTILQDRD